MRKDGEGAFKSGSARRAAWLFAAAPLGLALLGSASWQAAKNPTAKPTQKPSSAGPWKPFLDKFCIPCHSGPSAPSGARFDLLGSNEELLAARDLMQAAADKIKRGLMPPPGTSQPSAKQREDFLANLQKEFAKAPPAPPDPGRPTLRRLNRSEYNNTIRDLFGVRFSPADDFPSDDVGYGFDNIGDVLSISQLLMEKYLDAAEKITDLVLPPPKLKTHSFDAGMLKFDNGNLVENAVQFSTNSTAYVEPTLELAGRYRVRVLAYGQQAGPEPCKMTLRIDGKLLDTFEVRGTGPAQPFEVPPIELTAGKHRFAAAFINDYYNPNDPNPRNRDRNLLIAGIEVTGPLDADTTPNPAKTRLMIATPDAGDPLPAAQKILGSFLRRAFRRDVPAQELDRYSKFAVQAIKEKGSFEQGIKLAIQAALVSPSFLFRVELDAANTPQNPRAKPVVRSLGDFELASRLSYFLWSSMPDDALLDLAASGKLKQAPVLSAQVERMLKDPKSRALTQSFAAQWLNLRKLDTAAPDSDQFKVWNEELRRAMRQETELFFDSIVRENKPVTEFLDADYTFVNGILADLYGIPGVNGTQFRKVSLKDGNRAGILTQASLLTLTSNPNRTSPVKRGKWVLENLLGDAPPPPPPGLDALPEDKAVNPSATIKVRLTEHRSKPDCAVCHARMDPIGFSLENFDAVGRWRTMDGRFPVESKEKLPDGTTLDGPHGLRNYLLKNKDRFVQTLADRLLTFAVGRGMERSDAPALAKIVAQSSKSGNRFGSLILAVVQSDPFLKRRVN